MSDDGLRDAITRMATDSEFRASVERGDPGVLTGFDLTEAELVTLRGLSADDPGGGAEALGTRLSKSSIFLGGTLSVLHAHDTGTDQGAPEGSAP